MNLTYFIIGLATLNLACCYVLLQVRKGDNHSNVDALIHKVVPAKKYEKVADTARKYFKDYKPFKIKSQPRDLESFVLAIKTNGDKKNYGRRENNRDGNVWTNIKDIVMNFIEPDVNRPNLRSRAEKFIKKPELIQLKGSNEKPSLMYEIESASVLNSLQDVLGSQQARRYSDNIARAAAYVYRLIKEA